MAATTVYDINMRYLLEDRTKAGLDGMSKRVDRTGRSVSALGMGLKRIAGMAAGYFGFRAAKSALFDYNRELQDTQTNIAGLIMTTAKADWKASFGEAATILDELRDRAKKSTATTQEMAFFMNETIQPLMAAGMGTKQLASFTADAVVAAKAFNDEGIAAMDIQQALTKGVEIRDRFTRKLLGTIGMSREEFNKLDTAGRLETLQRAISSPAIRRLGQEQAETFSGAFSTLKDNLQQTFAEAGKGLFKSITAELREWNKWLEANGNTVRDMAKDFGKYLVEGFSMVREVIKFLVDNREVVMSLAKAALLFKGVRMAGGLIGDIGGSLGALRGAAGGAAAGLTGFTGGLAGAAASVGNIATLLGTVYLVAKGIADNIDRKQDAYIERRAEKSDMLLKSVGAYLGGGGRVSQQAQMAAAGKKLGMSAEQYASYKFRQLASESDMLGKGNKINVRAMLGQFGIRSGKDIFEAGGKGAGKSREAAYGFEVDVIKGMRTATAGDLIGRLEKINASNRTREAADMLHFLRGLERVATMRIIEPQAGFLDTITGYMGKAMRSEDLGIVAPGTGVNAKQGDVKVTIQKIEVKTEDPDRFAFQLSSALQSAARNPSASKIARGVR